MLSSAAIIASTIQKTKQQQHIFCDDKSSLIALIEKGDEKEFETLLASSFSTLGRAVVHDLFLCAVSANQETLAKYIIDILKEKAAVDKLLYNTLMAIINKKNIKKTEEEALKNIQLLCRLGAKNIINNVISVKDTENLTPIHFAARNQLFKICAFLIENGANYKQKYNYVHSDQYWFPEEFSNIGFDLNAKNFFDYYQKKIELSDPDTVNIQQVFLVIYIKERSNQGEYKGISWLQKKEFCRENKINSTKELLKFLRGEVNKENLKLYYAMLNDGDVGGIFKILMKYWQANNTEVFEFFTEMKKTAVVSRRLEEDLEKRRSSLTNNIFEI